MAKASVKSKNRNLLKVKAAAKGAANIYIYDEIGFWGITAKGLQQQLDFLGDIERINLHLNTPGGSVSDGLGIFTLLKSHPAHIAVHIDGVVASMGTVIAMAGDEIHMPENTLMMVHAPWVYTSGNADELRQTAEDLDKMAAALLSTYTARTGMSEEKAREIMAKDTWLTADEALELGLVDTVTSAIEAAASQFREYTLEDFKDAPSSLAALFSHGSAVQTPVEDEDLVAAIKKTSKAGAGKKADPAPVGEDNVEIDPAGSELDAAAITASATAAERKRIQHINSAVANAGMDPAKANEMIEGGLTIEQANAKIVDGLAGGQEVVQGAHAHVSGGLDEREKFVAGAEKALMLRAGLEGGERNEFTGMSLRELGRMSLTRQNVQIAGMDVMSMIGMAFTAQGMHTSSDFSHILENVANKSMLKGYEEAEETFERFTSKGNLSDFKITKKVDLNLFPSLEKVEDGAEYKHGTIGDTGQSVQLATYGKLFSITRHTIINDDMDILSRIPSRMGRAAKRTIGNLVFATITDNPQIGDGKELFHVDHKNLAGTGAAPSVNSLDDLRIAMMLQKDDEEHAEALNIRPKYVLVPVALESTTKTVIASEYDGAHTQKVKNPIQDMAEVISDGRLDSKDTDAWYGLADPMQHDGIEVSYLDGNDQPFMERREGWTVDGTQIKVRIDGAVAALSHRTVYKNPGK